MNSSIFFAAIGGKGSVGQNGGNGYVGKEDITTIGKSRRDGSDIWQKNFKKVEMTQKVKCESSAAGESVTENCETRYRISLECSIGGDGGKGGKGGRDGTINIYDLGDKSASFNVVKRIGSDGDGGKAGKFGTQPQKINVVYHHHHHTGGRGGGSSDGDWKEESREDDEVCLALQKPEDGANADEIDDPVDLIPYELYQSLNEFKEYVRSNQHNKLKRDDLIQFIKTIHDSPAVLANSSVKGFADELLKLEGQFFQLQHVIDLETYYFSVSNRIDQFVGKLNKSATPLEQLKIFNYLYAAAWSKFLSSNSSESLMVIDINNYLGVTAKNIQKYEKSLRQQTLDETRSNYRQEIQMKITEARSFIDNDIRPKIAELSASIDDSLDGIVNETVEKVKAIEQDIEAYRRQQAKLTNQLVWRGLFSTLDVVSGLGSLLGSFGLAAGGVAKSVSQIGSSFLENDGINKVADIPAGVKTALDTWNNDEKMRREKQIEALDKAIDKIQQQADPKKDLKEISDKMKELKDKLKVENAKENKDSAAITKFEKEMVEWIGKAKENINDVDKDLEGTLENIDTIMSVATKAVGEFLKFSDDFDKIKEIDKSIASSKSVIQNLYEFQNKIYSQVWPMVDEMRKTIDDIERGIKNKPHAALDLKK